ncbi:palm2-akap2 fusion S homeolog isoform X3 [Xenopus laevis]|uniref:Palm2-akap2 fusion S homeolog isoform X3 n=1 Tax=Xenopus laevis TaxID=8355 RepID=A0A8J0TV88_XENLA|nr:palm2-akap2 fusion S homeolog isoform X3 [Xenopus laevis]
MAEAELQRERLQAIAEKRKRQAAIEDKRRQLEDKILQLQHLKSKSLREKWLMQGAPAGSSEEEEARRKQCEEDEHTLKILEENVKRLEQDIGQLESEESLISAKEQILREKLKKTEISFEDLQKSLSNQERDGVNYIYSQIPDLTTFNLQKTETSLSGNGTTRVAALYAMEINVEKDRNTGETKVVSASALDPEGVHQRGVKVYDDGNKVVYEVHQAGAVVENGIHKLSARDVDELIQKSAQSNLIGGQEKECLPERTVTIEGNPSHVIEQMHFKEAKLELVHKPTKGVPVKHGQHARSNGNAGTGGTVDQPVTMIFMGYQNIEDEDETKKVLGYDDTIKAELVLIDEDDEKSLREKTVTDVSTMDGNTAELVSGKLLTETTEPSSPEGKEESLATEPIADVKKKTVQFKDPDENETEGSLLQLNKPQVPENDFNLRDKDQNSANFSDPARFVISKQTMEIDVPVSEHIILINQDDSADNQPVFLAVVTNQNGIKNRHESIDSDVAKEIQYLDDVLEANCCDTSIDNNFNGTPSPELCTITVGESSSFVGVTTSSASVVTEIIEEEPKQAPVVEISASEVMDPVKMNGHSQSGNKDELVDRYTYPASPNSSNSSRRPSKDGEILPKVIKKEAKFELRTFHEEKKPSKLFDDFNEKEHIRVRKVRPSEEVEELEKERLELIKSQAVKKNPGITTKWWNPPQEKTIEDQLDSDQLESHLKYKERKQKLQQQEVSPPAVRVNHLPPVLSEPPDIKKEDIVTQQIDFLAARKQFLNMENTNQPNFKPPPKRSVSANLFTVKPFYKSSVASKSYSCITVTNSSVPRVQSIQGETPLVKAERVNCISEDQPAINHSLRAETSPEPSAEKVSKTSAEEFVSTTTSFAVLKEDDNDLSDRFVKSVSVSFLPEEQDSGLDDLSVKSQDTTVMETLSNDFSMDNISDSGAPNETMGAQHDYSLGGLSQPQTPVNDTLNEYTLEEGSTSDQGFYSPSSMLHDIDDQLDYHAGILVQNVIQQALAEKAGFKDSTNSEDSDKSNYFDDSEPLTEKSDILSCSSLPVSPGRDHNEVFEPPQVSSPVQETKALTIPKTFEGEDFQLQQDNPSAKCIFATEQNCTEEHKQESYFSKYSQAAELRSTASILATQETEISVGPFKLRSKKQKTLSIIEEEIRAAQEREQELKKQRERQNFQSQHSPSNKSAPVLPTRTVSYKTAPEKETEHNI